MYGSVYWAERVRVRSDESELVGQCEAGRWDSINSDRSGSEGEPMTKVEVFNPAACVFRVIVIYREGEE